MCYARSHPLHCLLSTLLISFYWSSMTFLSRRFDKSVILLTGRLIIPFHIVLASGVSPVHPRVDLRQSLKKLLKYMKQMSPKVCVLDPIPTSLLFECSNQVVPLLTTIIDQSFLLAFFPSCMKSAVVKSLLKKQQPSLDPNVLKTIRPVSNLPSVSKLIEKLSELCSRALTGVVTSCAKCFEVFIINFLHFHQVDVAVNSTMEWSTFWCNFYVFLPIHVRAFGFLVFLKLVTNLFLKNVSTAISTSWTSWTSVHSSCVSQPPSQQQRKTHCIVR